MELALSRTAAGALVIEVQDDGPGVDPAVRPRVLEFGVTTKAAEDGPRGVGLALVARSAARLGGTRRGGRRGRPARRRAAAGRAADGSRGAGPRRRRRLRLDRARGVRA
ncbi:ATP-binding protein [Clavibacter zhangzhiyongii]|uniref:ATP-binding protein n=1 Tax=Clavibacter zhangzhiyongii TaxID=2768071 RepID=UPI0039E06B2E